MKKFVGLLQKKQTGQLTDELLQAHVQHLRQLEDTGVLLLCGPLKETDQAFQLLQAHSLAEAQLLFFSDPFIQSSYYQYCSLSELVEANSENNFLLKKI